MPENVSQAEPVVRKRAPRRQGHRAQLTVPAGAWDRAQELAAEQGTTPNDVLAQLVLRGLELVERERAIGRIADARTGAYRAQRIVMDGSAALPTVEEAEKQAYEMRRDLAGGA
jgi:hypothetical protein